MKRVAIIGGGLAGTACAYELKMRGLEPVIYEENLTLASGASGNEVGLYNPRLAAEKNAESEYFMAGFDLALRTFKTLKDIEGNPCGTLHLITDEKKEKRFAQVVKNWNLPENRMRLLDAQEAAKVAGVVLTHAALYLPESGTISPRKLCETYAKDVETLYGAAVQNLVEIKADAIILACGPGIGNFVDLPVKSVRGQITTVKATEVSKNLRCNLCYGGYMTPPQKAVHIIGATFQRWLDHAEVMNQDDADNIGQLAEIAPHLAAGLEVTGHRAAVRATALDHFPVVGALQDKLYISAAHGSHGILSTLMAAHVLTSMILKEPPLLPPHTLEKLSPARFRT